jgi:hypothetical protein
MIRMIDSDGDGQVNFKEFYKMAAGESLAPLGLALPPPRDLQEVKEMNQTMQKSVTEKNSEYSNKQMTMTNKKKTSLLFTQ